MTSLLYVFWKSRSPSVFLLVAILQINALSAFQTPLRFKPRSIAPASPTALLESPLSLDNSLTTLIAFFPTRGFEQQQNVVNTFKTALIPRLVQEPGFVSCHIHTSLDGSRVALYEQWNSLEDCYRSYGSESMATAVRRSLKYVLEVDDDSVDRHVYEIVGSAGAPVVDRPEAPFVQFAEFPTAEETQQGLLEFAWDHLLQSQPRPWTAAIHRSIDGAKVVNYAQWNDENGIHSEKAYWDGVTENEHRLYHLVSSHERGQ